MNGYGGMEFVRIKNTDLEVSRLCMGGCPLGGHGWGKLQEQELLAAVDAACEAGINFFDTADIYGLGKSEELLGQALKAKRHQVIIASKFGVRMQSGQTFYDNSRQWLEQSIVGSLKRLNTDYIDLYQVHYRDGVTEISELVESLEALKNRGYIRYYGLSNIYEQDKSELIRYKNKFASFQDEYSLANRSNEQAIVSLAAALNATPMTWGSLGQGILTGKYDHTVHFTEDDRRSRATYVNFYGQKLVKNLLIVDCLREISAVTGCAPGTLAIRFILDYIKHAVVLAGAKNPRQVKDNAKALGWKLDEEYFQQLLRISS